ncbi:enoyl-CoA hydratase/isomerase family protein [Pseudohalioglobus lutimaris]|uniref:Enoyl-CoA hydratase/isomerase family protein n=1 Tax=Pseudohalioglobus lutimaris TaxID=1737061 RepID=A0A2N5X3V3_9GAMM|nr:enoyl-CoA hydratase/isomerase family protein [Pseudohalioglobus lutimaris]PLW69171.1 hypothetical protein C0039_08910 [Pseudohalioglobus lutimaris]
MPRSPHTLSPAALEELCRQPASAAQYSTLTGCPLVLLDLLEDSPVTEQQREPLGLALTHMSCPVIAVAPTGQRCQLTDKVDVVVSSRQEAEPLIRNISRHPLAAMTLVQLLRHNDRANVQDGLLAESLAYATLQAGGEFRHYLATRPSPPEPPPNPEPAVLVARQGNQLHLTLNRPQQHNAWSIAMRDALFEGLQLQAADDSISKTIVRGAGDCFCSGGALEEFGLATDMSEAHAVRSSRHVGGLVAALAERVEYRLHKACIGSGIELPAFAGSVIAKPNTFFHLPEITMGLIPGAGGTVSILKRIGRQRMAYLALSARRIRATTALEWGLIDAIDSTVD